MIVSYLRLELGEVLGVVPGPHSNLARGVGRSDPIAIGGELGDSGRLRMASVDR